MYAWVVLAVGACVVSILAGLSEVWAAPICRPEPEAKRSREPVKPQLPPEVIAVLSRNARKPCVANAALTENLAYTRGHGEDDLRVDPAKERPDQR
jgi:hypothetical protein